MGDLSISAHAAWCNGGHEEDLCPPNPIQYCSECWKPILVMAFRNTGVCCENCRKDRDNDHSVNHAIIEAPLGGERK